MAFLKLPLELVRAIISHLSLEDILSLKRSCEFFSHMICEPDLQLYQSRLKKAGLRDRPPPEGLSVHERLAGLHRWESASGWYGDHNDHDENEEEGGGDEDNDPAGGIFADNDSATQRRVVEIEDSDPNSRVLVVEDFFVEMHALADGRANFCEYRFLDLRSSLLRWEDVRLVRHVFDQKVGLLSYAFSIGKYNLFAVLIEAPWLSNHAALQLMNFHDGKPHPLTPRPIPITDKGFCIARMHIIDDQILVVMTLDFPGRPESWITLVGLKDLCITSIDAPSKHFLDYIVILSHDTIALVNPAENTLDLCRIDISTATLHILRTLDLPPIHSDLSLFRASNTVHSSFTAPPTSPPPRGDVPAALFYEDPARTIICIALHYTDTTAKRASLDAGEWREMEEQARVLLVTRPSALLVLATAAQNAQVRLRTPWRTWSSSAARVLRLPVATANHDFGTHATSHERLFLFPQKTYASTTSTTTRTVTVTRLDFNPHRVSRSRTSSHVHEYCCACPRAVGSNTLRSDWKCGDCAGEDSRGCHEQRQEQEQENEADFTVKELPYRQTRIALPDDSDAYFGTDRIVFVRPKRIDQESGIGEEGLMCRRVIVHPMMG